MSEERVLHLPGGTKVILPEDRSVLSCLFYEQEEPGEGYLFLAEYPEGSKGDEKTRTAKIQKWAEAIEDLRADEELAEDV